MEEDLKELNIYPLIYHEIGCKKKIDKQEKDYVY